MPSSSPACPVSPEGEEQITSFTDEQIEMLVSNTQQLGAGLLMIGGPEAFGAGGWIGTKIEKAMPVDFKIKNTKIQAVGALALIMHASEMAEGNHWQKVIAKAAIEQLGPADYGGVLHWTMRGDAWLWGGNAGIAGSRAEPQSDVGGDRADDARRHAPVRSSHANGGGLACPYARFDQTLRDHQRW